MQILFKAESTPESYKDGTGIYPDAPTRCPHCHLPVPLRKHGFYSRYIVLLSFEGRIRIRRYICHDCGQTVSMLPSFCMPRHQYGVEIIIMAMIAALNNSVRYAGTRWPDRPQTMTRRHIIFYRDRVSHNREYIQLGINLMSPRFIDLKQIVGDTDWAKRFLEAATQINPLQFNEKYHRLTGKSFMSLQNSIA